MNTFATSVKYFLSIPSGLSKEYISLKVFEGRWKVDSSFIENCFISSSPVTFDLNKMTLKYGRYIPDKTNHSWSPSMTLITFPYFSDSLLRIMQSCRDGSLGSPVHDSVGEAQVLVVEQGHAGQGAAEGEGERARDLVLVQPQRPQQQHHHHEPEEHLIVSLVFTAITVFSFTCFVLLLYTALAALLQSFVYVVSIYWTLNLTYCVHLSVWYSVKRKIVLWKQGQDDL